MSEASNELSGELGSLMSSLIIPELMEFVMVKLLPIVAPPVDTRLFIVDTRGPQQALKKTRPLARIVTKSLEVIIDV